MSNLLSMCGLYCGNCKRYLKGSCPGCEKNVKATWCKSRDCVLDKKISNCAECTISSHRDCTLCNNPISKIFGFVFRSDRLKNLDFIAQHGEDAFIDEMKKSGKMSFKR